MFKVLWIFIVCFCAIAVSAVAGEGPRLTHISSSSVTALEPESIVHLDASAPLRLGIDIDKTAKYYQIQWYRNQEPLAGQTSQYLTLERSGTSLDGQYHALLTTPCSHIRTAAITVAASDVHRGVISRSADVSSIEMDDVAPNPVTDLATITFRVPKTLQVSLYVTDMVGNRMVTLVHSYVTAGEHTVEYVVANSSTASTMYNVVLESPGYSIVKPMVVVK